MTTTPKERKLALVAWVAVSLVWGTTYLGIRVCLETMPPMLMAIFCVLLGTLAQDHEAQAGSFFGSGMLVLTALLAAMWWWMRRSGCIASERLTWCCRPRLPRGPRFLKRAWAGPPYG